MNKKTGYHKIQDMSARFIHEILVCLTAYVFRVRPMHVLHLPKGKSLYRYAQFSKRCMEGVRKEDIPMYMERMYRMSYRLGRIVWFAAGFCGVRDKTRLVFFLYRQIGIRMKGNLPEKAVVTSCPFSTVYTPSMCAFIGAMDDGIVSGIFGEGHFRFRKRITEGCRVCAASLVTD